MCSSRAKLLSHGETDPRKVGRNVGHFVDWRHGGKDAGLGGVGPLQGKDQIQHMGHQDLLDQWAGAQVPPNQVLCPHLFRYKYSTSRPCLAVNMSVRACGDPSRGWATHHPPLRPGAVILDRSLAGGVARSASGIGAGQPFWGLLPLPTHSLQPALAPYSKRMGHQNGGRRQEMVRAGSEPPAT